MISCFNSSLVEPPNARALKAEMAEVMGISGEKRVKPLSLSPLNHTRKETSSVEEEMSVKIVKGIAAMFVTDVSPILIPKRPPDSKVISKDLEGSPEVVP